MVRGNRMKTIWQCRTCGKWYKTEENGPRQLRLQYFNHIDEYPESPYNYPITIVRDWACLSCIKEVYEKLGKWPDDLESDKLLEAQKKCEINEPA